MQQIRNVSGFRRGSGRYGAKALPASLPPVALPFAHLRPHLPGVEVPLLLGGQRIDPDSHACELEDCDPLVDLDGHPVNLVLERRGMLHHVLGAEGLIGEAHIHDAGGMPFGRSQVDEPSFSKDIDPLSVSRR